MISLFIILSLLSVPTIEPRGLEETHETHDYDGDTCAETDAGCGDAP